MFFLSPSWSVTFVWLLMNEVGCSAPLITQSSPRWLPGSDSQQIKSCPLHYWFSPPFRGATMSSFGWMYFLIIYTSRELCLPIWSGLSHHEALKQLKIHFVINMCFWGSLEQMLTGSWNKQITTINREWLICFLVVRAAWPDQPGLYNFFPASLWPRDQPGG